LVEISHVTHSTQTAVADPIRCELARVIAEHCFSDLVVKIQRN